MKIKSRRGNSAPTIILFIMILGMLVAAYTTFSIQTNTINQCPSGQTQTVTTDANGQQRISCIGFINANVGAIGNSNQVNVNANKTAIVPNCTSGTLLGGLYCAIINAGNILHADFQTAYCNLVGFAGGNTANCLLATNIGNTLSGQAGIQNSIGEQIGASATNDVVSNNSLLVFVSSPFGQAMVVLGIFLGLGVLAGLFGAGILAGTIAVAGIILSVITYMEGELGAFGSIPAIIYIPFQGLMAFMAIVLVYETLKGGISL